MFLEEIGELDKVLPTLLGCNVLPLALESLPGCGHSDIDILLAGLLDSYDRLLVCGVDGLKGLAVNTFDEFIVDEPESGWSVSGSSLNE